MVRVLVHEHDGAVHGRFGGVSSVTYASSSPSSRGYLRRSSSGQTARNVHDRSYVASTDRRLASSGAARGVSTAFFQLSRLAVATSSADNQADHLRAVDPQVTVMSTSSATFGRLGSSSSLRENADTKLKHSASFRGVLPRPPRSISVDSGSGARASSLVHVKSPVLGNRKDAQTWQLQDEEFLMTSPRFGSSLGNSDAGHVDLFRGNSVGSLLSTEVTNQYDEDYQGHPRLTKDSRASSVDFTLGRSHEVNPPLPPPSEPLQRLRARSFSYSPAYGSSGYNPFNGNKQYGPPPHHMQQPSMGQEFPQTLRSFHSASGMMPGQPQPPPTGVRPPRVSIPTDSPMHQYQVRLLVISLLIWTPDAYRRYSDAFAMPPYPDSYNGEQQENQSRQSNTGRGMRSYSMEYGNYPSSRQVRSQSMEGPQLFASAPPMEYPPSLSRSNSAGVGFDWSRGRMDPAPPLPLMFVLALVTAPPTSHHLHRKRTMTWSLNVVDRRSLPVVRPTNLVNTLRCVEADRGEDIGRIVQRTSDITKRKEEHEVFEVCKSKVRQRLLPMNVIDAEYQFDRHKLTFFFEADRYAYSFRIADCVMRDELREVDEDRGETVSRASEATAGQGRYVVPFTMSREEEAVGMELARSHLTQLMEECAASSSEATTNESWTRVKSRKSTGVILWEKRSVRPKREPKKKKWASIPSSTSATGLEEGHGPVTYSVRSTTTVNAPLDTVLKTLDASVATAHRSFTRIIYGNLVADTSVLYHSSTPSTDFLAENDNDSFETLAVRWFVCRCSNPMVSDCDFCLQEYTKRYSIDELSMNGDHYNNNRWEDGDAEGLHPIGEMPLAYKLLRSMETRHCPELLESHRVVRCKVPLGGFILYPTDSSDKTDVVFYMSIAQDDPNNRSGNNNTMLTQCSDRQFRALQSVVRQMALQVSRLDSAVDSYKMSLHLESLRTLQWTKGERTKWLHGGGPSPIGIHRSSSATFSGSPHRMPTHYSPSMTKDHQRSKAADPQINDREDEDKFESYDASSGSTREFEWNSQSFRDRPIYAVKNGILMDNNSAKSNQQATGSVSPLTLIPRNQQDRPLVYRSFESLKMYEDIFLKLCENSASVRRSKFVALTLFTQADKDQQNETEAGESAVCYLKVEGRAKLMNTAANMRCCDPVLQLNKPIITRNTLALDGKSHPSGYDFRQLPIVVGPQQARFYAGVPLTDSKKRYRYGAIAVFDTAISPGEDDDLPMKKTLQALQVCAREAVMAVDERRKELELRTFLQAPLIQLRQSEPALSLHLSMEISQSSPDWRDIESLDGDSDDDNDEAQRRLEYQLRKKSGPESPNSGSPSVGKARVEYFRNKMQELVRQAQDTQAQMVENTLVMERHGVPIV
ncbi:PSP1, C-terminal [Phytophthora cactorum]|nr:PSP1, C-terminal [Phytophthora cactorum]